MKTMMRITLQVKCSVQIYTCIERLKLTSNAYKFLQYSLKQF